MNGRLPHRGSCLRREINFARISVCIGREHIDDVMQECNRIVARVSDAETRFHVVDFARNLCDLGIVVGGSRVGDTSHDFTPTTKNYERGTKNSLGTPDFW